MSAALGQCRVCHKPVSTSAEICPHCGEDHPTPESAKTYAGAAGCALAAFVISALGFIGFLWVLFS